MITDKRTENVPVPVTVGRTGDGWCAEIGSNWAEGSTKAEAKEGLAKQLTELASADFEAPIFALGDDGAVHVAVADPAGGYRTYRVHDGRVVDTGSSEGDLSRAFRHAVGLVELVIR